MRYEVLPAGALALIERIAADPAPEWKGWTLAGGTGLALQLGHRDSEDLDFFRTMGDVNFQRLHGLLRPYGPLETLQEGADTLTVLLSGIKLSFFRVFDPFLFDSTPCRWFAVADRRDIALMKLAAVSGRGGRRDFVDLYTILREPPGLQEYFDLLPKKYGAGRANAYHVLKSLTFFEDAEKEPMPRMRIPFDWEDCRRFFEREARRIVLGP